MLNIRQNNKYISGTDIYPHMPILRPHAAHNAYDDYPLAAEHARWAINPILSFWGSKVHKNLWFPVLDADEPPSKIWRH